MKKLICFFSVVVLLLAFVQNASSQAAAYIDTVGIKYRTSEDPYVREKCDIRIHYPVGGKDRTTIVWFHGGGLTGGDNSIPEALRKQGFIVVSAAYRLSPRVKVKEIIGDAAAAVKWAYDHVESYGGNRRKIVISGHSAGGYLALMLGLNKSYLAAEQVDVDSLLGVFALSGQTITHFTARKEMGLAETQPLVDELAPVYWVRGNSLPIVLVTGDRELEMLGRYEENAYLARMLKVVGNDRVRLFELDGYGHNMTFPAFPLLLEQTKSWERD